MSGLTAFWIMLMTLMGIGPNPVLSQDRPPTTPPPNAGIENSGEEESIDWVEIQRRLLNNGKDSIFNGV